MTLATPTPAPDAAYANACLRVAELLGYDRVWCLPPTEHNEAPVYAECVLVDDAGALKPVAALLVTLVERAVYDRSSTLAAERVQILRLRRKLLAVLAENEKLRAETEAGKDSAEPGPAPMQSSNVEVPESNYTTDLRLDSQREPGPAPLQSAEEFVDSFVGRGEYHHVRQRFNEAIRRRDAQHAAARQAVDVVAIRKDLADWIGEHYMDRAMAVIRRHLGAGSGEGGTP